MARKQNDLPKADTIVVNSAKPTAPGHGYCERMVDNAIVALSQRMAVDVADIAKAANAGAVHQLATAVAAELSARGIGSALTAKRIMGDIRYTFFGHAKTAGLDQLRDGHAIDKSGKLVTYRSRSLRSPAAAVAAAEWEASNKPAKPARKSRKA